MAAGVPDLSIIILSWNTRELLRECLGAVRQGTGVLRVETIVIDNASSDGSPKMVARDFPEVLLERNEENRGYAGGVNQGLRRARGRCLALLGSDTRVAEDALPRLVGFLDAHSRVGAVAPRLLNPDGTIQRACMRFPSLRTVLWWDTPLQAWFPEGRELRRYQMRDWDHRGSRRVEQPPGTCLVLRREAYETVGAMDERLWLFFNDVDWARRLERGGWEMWYLDTATVVHHLGGSTRHFADFGAEWHRNRIQYYRKHHGVVGAFLSKAALIYVALRQCWRIRAGCPNRREYRAQVRTILGAVASILAR